MGDLISGPISAFLIGCIAMILGGGGFIAVVVIASAIFDKIDKWMQRSRR